MCKQAHESATAMKESKESQEYKAQHAIVMKNEAQTTVIEDYREKIMALQMDMAQGNPMDDKKMEELRSLEQLMNANTAVRTFLEAEQRFATAYGDVQKIISDAISLSE